MRNAHVLLSSLACLGGIAVPAAAAVPLAAHRAVYDLSLVSASDQSGITSLKGRMVYEFNGSACDGYTTTFRFVTQIDTSEASRLTDQQTTTFEDADGENFSFVTRSFADSELDKEIKGTAKREPDGLEVDLEKPDPETLKLVSTQFPTQHLKQLLGKASTGETFYETNLYDGSNDGDEVMTTTVVLGKKAQAAEGDPELQVLAGQAKDGYWPVDIAYFNETSEGGEVMPEYRMSFKLHENGLTRDLVMDYGTFSMAGRLVNLSVFPADTACKAAP